MEELNPFEESQSSNKSVARISRKQVAPWSKEDTRELIQLIEARECLWNVDKGTCKNGFVRAAAWYDVRQKMGREDCQPKWNSLRTNYRARVIALSKTKRGQEIIADNELSEPNSLMKFLLPYIKCVQNDHDSNLSSTSTSGSPIHYSGNEQQEDLPDSKNEIIDPFLEVLLKSPPVSPPRLKTKRKREEVVLHREEESPHSEEEAPYREDALNRMNDATEITTSLQPSRSNAWGAFGNHIAATGRNMDIAEPMLAQLMKMEIQSTILKFETMVFEKQSARLLDKETRTKGLNK